MSSTAKVTPCRSCPSLYILLLSVDLHNVKLAPLYLHQSFHFPHPHSKVQQSKLSQNQTENCIPNSLSGSQWRPPPMGQETNCSCPWSKINHTTWPPLCSESAPRKSSHISLESTINWTKDGSKTKIFPRSDEATEVEREILDEKAKATV